tara:strand:- start:10 stop:303 length:294 start_codon:yes stop_codon:yes gene_type:complete
MKLNNMKKNIAAIAIILTAALVTHSAVATNFKECENIFKHVVKNPVFELTKVMAQTVRGDVYYCHAMFMEDKVEYSIPAVLFIKYNNKTGTYSIERS